MSMFKLQFMLLYIKQVIKSRLPYLKVVYLYRLIIIIINFISIALLKSKLQNALQRHKNRTIR